MGKQPKAVHLVSAYSVGQLAGRAERKGWVVGQHERNGPRWHTYTNSLHTPRKRGETGRNRHVHHNVSGRALTSPIPPPANTKYKKIKIKSCRALATTSVPHKKRACNAKSER